MKRIINRNFFILLSIVFFDSCKKKPSQNNETICSFQNLVCAPEKSKDSTEIENVETFLLFSNTTNDTIKISIKNIQEDYRHVNRNDTLSLIFEGLNPISIPPKDTLGVPCISKLQKSFSNNDSVFISGFKIINVKTKKAISNTKDYRLEKTYDFQLYKKWGRKSDNIDL